MKRVSALWTNDKVRSECRIHGNSDPLVERVTFSSQDCSPRSIFIAFRGLHRDAHLFIDQAIANGAVVIVHQDELDHYRTDVLYVSHCNPRRIASLFCHALSAPLPSRIIGVTGTDGKSSTCEFLWHILSTSGIRCGLLSTVSMDDGTGKIPSPFRQSTPEVPQLYAFLQRCRTNGLDIVILESTSHGLSNQAARMVDIPFFGAIFTQITSEHLEFHGDIASYVDAKMNLARQVNEGATVVVPADFAYRETLSKVVKSSVGIHTYGGEDSDACYKSLVQTLATRVVRVSHRDHEFECSVPYGQECFTGNAVGALLFALESGLIGAETIRVPIHFPPIAGRFEVVETHLPFTIIIDFAHTAHAFELLFSHVRKFIPHARMVALFGAAGERDTSKRFPMGAVAGIWCDALFLTDEDPRGESSSTILDEIEAGVRSTSPGCPVFRIHDRALAMEQAMDYCGENDVLLLLAKGHEGTITYRDHSIPWNERALVETLAKGREQRNGE